MSGVAFGLVAVRPVRFTPARAVLLLGSLAAVTLVALALSVLLGEYRLHLGTALTDPASADARVLFGLRLPRAVLGALVGAVVAAAIIQRREVQRGVAPGSPPPARDPGSGRKAK